MTLPALHRQFLITFASMGAVLAYLPVLLEQRLDQTIQLARWTLGSSAQVGVVMSTTGLAIILTPVIMTALADTKVQSRTLITALFAVSAVTCFWQALSFSFVGLLISHTVFAFFFWPLAALQDGLVFADNQQARTEGRAQTPYHHVRVYGTVGFALPLGGLYFLINVGLDVSSALYLGGALCVLGAVNAMTLPRTPLGQARRARFNPGDESRIKPELDGSKPLPLRGGGREGVTTNLRSKQEQEAPAPSPNPSLKGGGFKQQHDHPTRAAARVLFRGPALVFCICLFIAHLGNSAYYAFYPIYLTNEVNFGEQWVGPITMLGVVLELGVMACVGLMLTKFGLKRLLVLALVIMAARFALLGVFPNQAVAVWTQVLHGITVVGIYVIPPIYLNALAGDHFRSSIQGLYAMTVFGPSRIAGNILGGELADVSLPMMFNLSAVTTLLAAVAIAVLMRMPKALNENAEDVPALVEGD